ncbi:nuclear receptor subfamily 2 group C member 2 [Rhinolophus ferrumequinum]|uniref:Nuclear receptor subfamily 2 group C member 2 n=1 Tax=Rhinolophus ferrumequinum TaxID=59479 RepID=A0A7J7UK36_RHIFE|nr:nuclear receptor subfamily 2 group C member 2 [Rhinolophus ferrumequinum]
MLVSDCDRPADRTEDPDSHRSGRLRLPQAAVHPDQPRWSWNWEGDPGFPGDIQRQAAHIHHLGQPRPRQDPDCHRLCFCGAFAGEGRRPTAPGSRVLCGLWRQSLR